MTQSWLVDLFLNCADTPVDDVVCPNATAVAAFDAAVRRGDINWHAFPFNAEPELFTPELFDAALNMTFRADARYGHAPRRTLSQRDVPGLTRNALAPLARRGVRGVSVGENAQVAPSAVPPIFLWRDQATGSEVVGMFHALGYGGAFPSSTDNAATATDGRYRTYRTYGGWPAAKRTHYLDADGRTTVYRGESMPFDDGPGIHVTADGAVEGNASRSEACVSVEAAGVALCYAWKVDNSGPHAPWQSELVFDVVDTLFPEAKGNIVASDAFDDFVDEVWRVRATLPVVDAEIGDTWMFGADADPRKVALFRAASRVHAGCVRRGDCVAQANGDASALHAFERLLMLAGEHTWGWDGGDIRSKSWTNPELAESLETDWQFSTAVEGWQEQRKLLRGALAALPAGSPLAVAVQAAWAAVEGAATGMPFDISGMRAVGTGTPVACGGFRLTVGEDGAVVGLEDAITGARHAAQNASLFRLWYQGMDAAFFKTYVGQYISGISSVWPEFTAENLYKPNLKAPAVSCPGVADAVYSDPSRVVIRLAFNATAHADRGAPATAEIEHVCGPAGDATLNTTVRWFNKTATHIPETLWLSNVPTPLTVDATTPRVVLDKLGAQLDAMDVDLGCDGMHHLTCGVHLHGVGDGGVVVMASGAETTLVSWDSALVSIGVASPVPTPLIAPDIRGGVHWALVGNIWNTNYPFWYPFEEDDTSSQFRFTWRFRTGKKEPLAVPERTSSSSDAVLEVAAPALFFGPTANLKAPVLSALVGGLFADLSAWSTLRGKLARSGGALHLRKAALAVLSSAEQQTLASASTAAGVAISIEGGGALCGPGSGNKAAQAVLKQFAPFLSAGGTIQQWLLESVFSRTHAGCPGQPQSVTIRETAQYAAKIASGIRPSGNAAAATTFFLYDALPHYSVDASASGGKVWPANTVGVKYGLELGATVRGLRAAMAAENMRLSGYWADCPFEYSRDFPNASAPAAGDAGFFKIAAALRLIKGMGLRFAKTFNSQQGGQTSAEAFFNGTLSDWERVAQRVPSAASGGFGFDSIMVETWYSYPARAIPEGMPFTTANTTLQIFDRVKYTFPGR